ncbi:MAG: flagellar basal body P-ring formation chaperone FlgA, partial [Burkholderiales bacterium]|nr:flagellar basal body P-ring formation chaperone FlgA [Burkholderiales bacterium]
MTPHFTPAASSRRPAQRHANVLGVVVGAVSLLSAWGVQAQVLDHFARQWIDQALEATADMGQSTPLRPEVIIGTLDPRLQLAPCGRIEPYLPKGTQLWGRTRVGLKCVEGPVAWNVFLPVTVKAWGPAWVMKKTVQANTLLQPGDAEKQSEVDWADARSPIVALPEQWQGMQAAFTLLPGQAIRQNAVRPPQAFTVGSEVRVVTSGVGFEMSAMGQAMSAGLVG